MLTSVGYQIVEDIKAYIGKCGGSYSGWYVGISHNAENRLFNEHTVRKHGDAWIFRTASSAKEARIVEAYFVNELGSDGGTGGGDITAKMVYAYKKAYHTNP